MCLVYIKFVSVMLCHAILYQWYNLIKAGKGLFSGIFPKEQGSDFLGERNDSIVKYLSYEYEDTFNSGWEWKVFLISTWGGREGIHRETRKWD